MRSCLPEFHCRFAERVSLQRAAFRESLREEVEHDRALPELFREVKLEGLAADRTGRREIRGL